MSYGRSEGLADVQTVACSFAILTRSRFIRHTHAFARVRALLGAVPEAELQRSTTVGGLCGLSFALILIVIDFIVG